MSGCVRRRSPLADARAPLFHRGGCASHSHRALRQYGRRCRCQRDSRRRPEGPHHKLIRKSPTTHCIRKSKYCVKEDLLKILPFIVRIYLQRSHNSLCLLPIFQQVWVAFFVLIRNMFEYSTNCTYVPILSHQIKITFSYQCQVKI